MNIKLLTEHHLEFLSLKGGCTGSCQNVTFFISFVVAHIADKEIAGCLAFIVFFLKLRHVISNNVTF